MLDAAVVQFAPNDPRLHEVPFQYEPEYLLICCLFFNCNRRFTHRFIHQVRRKVFDHIVQTENFERIRATRHFGALVLHLVVADNVEPLMRHLLRIRWYCLQCSIQRYCSTVSRFLDRTVHSIRN